MALFHEVATAAFISFNGISSRVKGGGESANLINSITFSSGQLWTLQNSRIFPNVDSSIPLGTLEDCFPLGKILSNGRCYVTGVQIVKRHTKPNPNAGIAGGVLEKEASIHLSNIAIYNSKTKKADKVSIKLLEDGSKVRVFKSSGEEIK